MGHFLQHLTWEKRNKNNGYLIMQTVVETTGSRFSICQLQTSKGDTVVRGLASHQCGLGLNPGINAISGLSLLLVLSLALRGFSLGTSVLLSPQNTILPNSSSIWNAWTRLKEFLRNPKYFVGNKLQFTIFLHTQKSTFILNCTELIIILQ